MKTVPMNMVEGIGIIIIIITITKIRNMGNVTHGNGGSNNNTTVVNTTNGSTASDVMIGNKIG